MQLKIKRSQKTGGVMTTNVIFCLDARIEFTPSEAQDISRYKLAGQIIYNSEASRRLLDKSAAQQDGSTLGGLKALATLAMVGLKLNISIASLQRGQHVECKSLDELLGAEEAIMEACQNLKGYLQTASAFDGREILISFDNDAPTVIAQAASPNPQLFAPLPASAVPLPPPPAALAPPPEDAEFHDVAEASEHDATSFAESPPYRELGMLDGLPFDLHDQQTQQRLVVIAIGVCVVVAWLISH